MMPAEYELRVQLSSLECGFWHRFEHLKLPKFQESEGQSF